MRDRTAIGLYLAWAAATIVLALGKGGASPDNITHGVVLLLLGAEWLLEKPLARLLVRVPLRRRFVGLSMAFAALVELAHMISNPLDPTLRLDLDTPLAEALRRCAIDLVLTAPAYAVIFTVIARMAARFRYRTWEFAILMAAGQALGDGNAFFVTSPAMLIFLPYVMLNYHAMQLVPYLLVREELRGSEEGWRRVAWPLIALPVTYLSCGVAIKVLGRALGWLP
jgi:hypothetical protein